MIQSSNLSKLLLQLLEPVPEITQLQPVSISLLSLTSLQPLLSFISKNYNNQDKIDNDINDTSTLPVDSENDTILQNLTNQTVTSRELKLQNKKSKVELLQEQLHDMDDQYSNDYINANINPSDNLKILALLAIKNWNTIPHENCWQVYRFQNYHLFMYGIDTNYAILLCCECKYPVGLALSRLKSLCEYLKGSL